MKAKILVSSVIYDGNNIYGINIFVSMVSFKNKQRWSFGILMFDNNGMITSLITPRLLFAIISHYSRYFVFY